MTTATDCVLGCQDPDIRVPGFLPVLDIRDDDPRRIVAVCSECGQELPDQHDRPAPTWFVGSRVRAGGGASVRVHRDGGAVEVLPMWGTHSPTGFQWGYGGSGPAALAQSILSEVLRVDAPPWLYQEFKGQWIQVISDDTWEISAGEVIEWMAGELARKADG